MARIAAERHDVVLMECQMPELDGFEATRVVREREAIEGGHVRIVAMIANAMAGDRDRCIASGMDDYVTKPIKVERIVEQQRLTLEIRQQQERPAAQASPRTWRGTSPAPGTCSPDTQAASASPSASEST